VAAGDGVSLPATTWGVAVGAAFGELERVAKA
jgi:hypothetical protein